MFILDFLGEICDIAAVFKISSLWMIEISMQTD